MDTRLAKAYLNSGLIHYRREELVLAESDLRSGLETAPDDPRLLIAMSLVLSAQGNQRQAEAYIGRAESLAKGNPEVVELLAQARQNVNGSHVQ